MAVDCVSETGVAGSGVAELSVAGLSRVIVVGFLDFLDLWDLLDVPIVAVVSERGKDRRSRDDGGRCVVMRIEFT